MPKLVRESPPELHSTVSMQPVLLGVMNSLCISTFVGGWGRFYNGPFRGGWGGGRWLSSAKPGDIKLYSINRIEKQEKIPNRYLQL